MTRHSQQQLLVLLRDAGPLTVRQISRCVYGKDERKLRIRTSLRINRALRVGLVEFDGFGERSGRNGLMPARWRVAY